MTIDLIAIMLTNIRNATAAHHKTVTVPYSKINWRIAEILKNKGYLNKISREDSDPYHFVVGLEYLGSQPKIKHLKRISKPSRRLYIKANNVKPILGNRGFTIISTSRGLITSDEIADFKIGGEILVEVW